MINLFKPKKNGDDLELKIDKDNLPEHIAIIMDGNGRWAKKRNLPRTMGHKAGVETIRRVIKEADRIGIKYITLYAFSTENWRRPQEEVTALMKLLVQYLKSEVKELHKNEVVLRVLGEIDKLPKECEREIKDAIELTKNNKGLILNIAFNYGGRDEIVRAIKLIAEELLVANKDSYDYAVLPCNTALTGNIVANTSLPTETEEVRDLRANVIAASVDKYQKDEVYKAKIDALSDAVLSSKTADYILEKYNNVISVAQKDYR